MGLSISPDKFETDRFAYQAANDKNPVHSINAGKRQILPGDWQVFFYLQKFGIPSLNHSIRVDFIDSLKPSTKFKYARSGLYLLDGNPVSKFSRKDSLEFCGDGIIDVVLGNTKGGENYIKPFIPNFGNVGNAAFALNYLQASADIGQFLLSDFFEVSQKELSEKITGKVVLPLFRGGEFSFDSRLEITDLGELERRALKPQFCSEEMSKNKSRTNISFPFILTNKKGDIVGEFRKNLMCSYIVDKFL